MKVTLNKFGRGLGLLLLFAVCALGVAAQQASTGTLRGQLTDEFGGVIVGATVTATDAGGKVKTVTSDNDGSFIVAGLVPGRYTVRAFAPGFALYENAEVDIQPGRNELPKITLGVSLEKEEVTVASEGPVSIDNASAGAIVLKGKDLEALPEDPDELAAALSALAGPAAGPNGGQITIDGFEGGRIPPKDSIREIRVNDNPLSAERDQPGFGGIQIFTKPGTDKLRGSLGATFNDESFNSRNPFLRSSKRPPFQFRQYAGNLSGTIIPKKASFFLDFERGETDDNDLINATILDPLSLQPTGFNAAVLTPRRSFNMSPRVDYAINQNHTLVGRYSFFRQSLRNLGVSQFSLPERAFDTMTQSHTLQLTETAILNKTTVNETRFQFIRNRNEQNALSNALYVNVLAAFEQGGATVGDSFSQSSRWELTNTTTQAHGTHSLKFGVRVRGINLKDFSRNNFNGTFVFGGGSAVALDANNQVVFQNGVPVFTQVTSLEQFRRTRFFATNPLPSNRGSLTLTQLGIGATQFSLAGGEPLADISQVDFGGFIQDDWKVRPNLTLGGGLRYEGQTNIGSNLNFAPRVYLAWSPDGTGGKQAKTIIRLGFGIFYDRIGENVSLQSLRFNGVNQQQFIISQPRIGDDPARAQTALNILSGFPNLPTVEQLSAFSVRQTTRQLAPDAEAPYSYISGVILTRQLTKTATLNVFFSTYDTRHMLRSRNINAPVPATGLRPRPELGNIFEFETSGTQSMKQLNISVSKQFNRAFSISANYTLGKAQGSTDFNSSFPVNQYDLTGEYARTSFDARHRFFLFGSMGIPYLKLSLNPIIIANTGRPFNITTGTDNNGDGIINDRPAFADSQTPACPAGANPLTCDFVHTSWGDFDKNPKPGQKIIPRNYAQGPGFIAFNLRVGRTFSFGDLPGANKAAAAPSTPAAASGGTQDAAQGKSGGDDKRAGGGNRGGGEGNRGGGGGGGRPGGGATVTPGMGGPMIMMMGGPGGGEQKRYSLNFSLNFMNLFNHVNFTNPVGILSSPNFGQSLSALGGGFGGGNQAAGNRRIQASVRFTF
jgi:hypothetical protein